MQEKSQKIHIFAICKILYHQTIDIADVADGGGVFADELAVRDFEDVDDVGIHQIGTGLGGEVFEFDGIGPRVEEQGGVAAIANQHRAVGFRGLRVDH